MYICVERLKELLRAKLVECGWKDQLKAHCKGTTQIGPICINCVVICRSRCTSLSCVLVVSLDVIKEKGLEHVTVEDLVTVITPKGRGMILRCRLCTFCEKNIA